MPQISPISWVTVLLLFSLLFLVVKSQLAPVMTHKESTLLMKPKAKTLPW